MIMLIYKLDRATMHLTDIDGHAYDLKALSIYHECREWYLFSTAILTMKDLTGQKMTEKEIMISGSQTSA